MVDIQELKTNKYGDVRVAILTYKGENDPVKEIDEELHKYVGDRKYFEFVDINMDNPWTRVVVFGEL